MKLEKRLTYKPVELKFGTSGLRGLVSDMTDLECYINVTAFLEFLKQTTQTPLNTIFLAGDLRESTPRILQAVAQAVVDNNLNYVYCGQIPTPALALYAQEHNQPGIMVTGSHIPANRNGIKFYKCDGEILKDDEDAIKQSVDAVRQRIYQQERLQFDSNGQLVECLTIDAADESARRAYTDRYTAFFVNKPLQGKKLVMYQHSAVGRDLIPEILERLGAEVIRVDRSEKFVPIDTENVTEADARHFRHIAKTHPDCYAILSTDGDSDRPFMIDAKGVFYRGDILGLPTSDYLGIDAAVIPVSSNDAVLKYLSAKGIATEVVKIGSPFVIAGMNKIHNRHNTVVGWEVNGGYLLGSEIIRNGVRLKALVTRDALLPLICTLLQAIGQQTTIQKLFLQYPQRFTQAGLIDDFPQENSQKILKYLLSLKRARTVFEQLPKEFKLGKPTTIDATDGIRITLNNDDVIHIRPSGNAPQLRIYSNTNTQERADELVAFGIQEPGGILRTLEKLVS